MTHPDRRKNSARSLKGVAKLMALRPLLDSASIDAIASAACQGVADGSRSPDRVRHELLELVMSSSIIDECARSGANAQRAAGQVPIEFQDLRDRMLDMLTDKILGRPEIEFLDLSKVAGGESFCGWTRNLLRSSVRFHRLRHYREYQARGAHERLMPHHSASGPGGYVAGMDSVAGAAHNVHGELFESAHADPRADARVDAVVAGFLADRPALRGDPLLIRQARTAVRGLGLRPPKPLSWRFQKARARISSLLDAASDSDLLDILGMVADEQMPPPGSERTFASMWTSHSGTEIERIRMFGAATVRLLTRAAITPVPALRQGSVRMLNERVSQVCGLVPRSCTALTSAWADSVCEMTGSEWGTDAIRERTPAEMEQVLSVFDVTASRFLAGDDSLGSDVDEVSATLGRLFESVETDRLSSRESEMADSERESSRL